MKLYHWREKEKLTRADLANRLGVTRQCVLLWERGERKPRPDKAKEIIKMANGDIAWGDLY